MAEQQKPGVDPNAQTANAGGSIGNRSYGFVGGGVDQATGNLTPGNVRQNSGGALFREYSQAPQAEAAAQPEISPGMLAAQQIIGSGSFRNKGNVNPLSPFAGIQVAGNVFGANNASAIQDIAAAISRGETITDAQWAQAGYGPGGTQLGTTSSPTTGTGTSLTNIGLVPQPTVPQPTVPQPTPAVPTSGLASIINPASAATILRAQ